MRIYLLYILTILVTTVFGKNTGGYPSLRFDVATSLAVFKDLMPASSCARTALQSLLNDCQRILQPSERSYYAAALSKCEFESAAVQYPDICRFLDDTTSVVLCANELETRAQWWTTYSGNYRLVGHICYENAKEYEKEQIIELYINASVAQGVLVNSLQDLAEFLNANIESWKTDVGDITNIFQNEILSGRQELSNLLRQIEKGVETQHKRVMESFLDIETETVGAEKVR